MSAELNHIDLYRLPWTLPDNAISWLEPTSKCNLFCEGCYRKNEPDGHKPLNQIRRELEIFRKLRKTDSVSIAGGDPLTHPDIEAIVAMIAESGQKPIVNTNGLLLTREKLRALKKAGVAGFTFHIDSGQHRPGMNGKSEIELNDLRLKYAEMLAEAGGICCAFNATVYGHTLKYVPDIIEWGQKNIDIVHTLVFIAYRAAPVQNGYDYYVGSEKVDMEPIAYTIKDERDTSIMSPDIIKAIRERFPDLRPAPISTAPSGPTTSSGCSPRGSGPPKKFTATPGLNSWRYRRRCTISGTALTWPMSNPTRSGGLGRCCFYRLSTGVCEIPPAPISATSSARRRSCSRSSICSLS